MSTYASQPFSADSVKALSDEISQYLDDNTAFVPVTVGLSQNQEAGFNAVLIYNDP